MTTPQTLQATARPLPDPAALTTSQKRALRLAHSRRLIMVRNGWRAGTDQTASFKTTNPLEDMGLVRRKLERARWRLVATGNGVMVLGIMDQRLAAKGRNS